MFLLGDCLEEMRKIPASSIDAVITDPPYGINYSSCRRKDRSKRLGGIANDKAPYIWWLLEAARILKPGGAVLCFTRFDTENSFREAMRNAGLTDKAQIIWDKGIHGMGDLSGDFASQHENIIFATKGKFRFPGKRPKSILRVQRVSPLALVHPNEKPTELMRQLVTAVTPPRRDGMRPIYGSWKLCRGGIKERLQLYRN